MTEVTGIRPSAKAVNDPAVDAVRPERDQTAHIGQVAPWARVTDRAASQGAPARDDFRRELRAYLRDPAYGKLV